jgi:2-haloacid dehalogenase
VPLYAITNFPDRFWDQFAPTEPATRHFRAVVVSGKEKLAKPDPAIFRLAEARFGHPPSSMLFIDDSERNVDAARACGWQAHRFTGAGGLAAELRQRGLIG